MVVAVLSVALVHTNVQLRMLSNQISYMQDNITVISSNVGNLESNIEAQLEEETSLLEKFDISLTDINFGDGWYKVDILVIPKAYTESTTVSAFFGTAEYPLERSGFQFEGSALLPIDDDYAGNVTVVFTDGERRETEVVSRYKGVQLTGVEYMTGSSDLTCVFDSEEPEEEERVTYLQATGNVDVQIDGGNLFSYQSVSFEVVQNGVVVYSADLLNSYQSVADESRSGKVIPMLASEMKDDGAEAEIDPETDTETETEEETETKAEAETEAETEEESETEAETETETETQTEEEPETETETEADTENNAFWLSSMHVVEPPVETPRLNAVFGLDTRFEVHNTDHVKYQIRAKTTDGYTMLYEIGYADVSITQTMTEDEKIVYSYKPDEQRIRYFYFFDKYGKSYKKAISN